jgi:Nif-specific regulatory protein
VLGHAGTKSLPPEDTLQSALDGIEIQFTDRWACIPNSQQLAQGNQQQVLSIECDDPQRVGAIINDIRDPLFTAISSWSRYRQLSDRALRAETILAIAAQWHGIKETDELVTEIVKASTTLLGAERASLFLWDQDNHELVARPALGVEGGELRVPEDTGVVGEVVRTGDSLRVDEIEGAGQINRDVDSELDFVTRNLICCPLKNEADEILGALQVLNKQDGVFTSDDLTVLEELASHIMSALQTTRQIEKLISSRSVIAAEAAQELDFIGDSPQMVALKSTIHRIADTDLSILILGENGTGKEVVSQLVHYESGRSEEPLVAVNCAALTETLLESELFGHVRGAFTDAHADHVGKFELATNGTLLLDEIGDMSLAGQAKLLRVLEAKEVVRVGGSTPIRIDTRVIAATNQDLAEKVRGKTFREDLFFRLNVVTLEVPALRLRGEDIVLLAEHFLGELSVKARRKTPRLKASARKRLLAHTWPGNVRELRNVVERLVYLTDGDTVEADDLDFVVAPGGSGSQVSLELSLNDATREFQMQYIQSQIKRLGGNMTEVAKHLGVHRSNLYRKLHQLGFDVSEE